MGSAILVGGDTVPMASARLTRLCCTCVLSCAILCVCVQYGPRKRKFQGHTMCVNACSPLGRGAPLVASASDDCSVKVGSVCVCICTCVCPLHPWLL
jgi:hypothetical protein